MVPQVSQPAGIVDAVSQPQISFVYQELLAYYRGDLADAHHCAAIEERVRKDRRWQAHWESIRYLDLDRAAATQDAADLNHFETDQATPMCRAVAASAGQVLEPLLTDGKRGGEWSRKEWNHHTRNCTYCRRMYRLLYARAQRREVGLSAREPLLRDWLLQPCYLPILAEVTRRLGGQWPANDVEEHNIPSSGDTHINQDTLFQPPPQRNA
jgi:hypothetical protein